MLFSRSTVLQVEALEVNKASGPSVRLLSVIVPTGDYVSRCRHPLRLVGDSSFEPPSSIIHHPSRPPKPPSRSYHYYLTYAHDFRLHRYVSPEQLLPFDAM